MFVITDNTHTRKRICFIRIYCALLLVDTRLNAVLRATGNYSYPYTVDVSASIILCKYTFPEITDSRKYTTIQNNQEQCM